ncbi:DUF1816 domain-containing protein [Vacuolonema iberomarrocanum]|uniref:DUF1816 domain-containing protein n=1 Tax=Vacuolonema iberomarrocanum TaxID=3454632 RepID=UPI0019FBBDDE|nr:DUF1816 domain-containing protein [filamentous cyanobacterium LEGE 07170]
MQELWTNILQTLGLAWWIEVTTETPSCTYYFGPFSNANTANAAKQGYVTDLEQEGAQGITVAIKRCKPSQLTIPGESSEPAKQNSPQLFSSQA